MSCLCANVKCFCNSSQSPSLLAKILNPPHCWQYINVIPVKCDSFVVISTHDKVPNYQNTVIVYIILLISSRSYQGDLPMFAYTYMLRIDKGYQGAVAHFGICVHNNRS